MSEAETPESDNTGCHLPDQVSLGGLPISQLEEMLLAERNFLLAIAMRELGKNLGAKGGASDLVQETCLNVTRDLRHFSGRTKEEFRGWLRSILQHNLLNFRRHFLDTAKRDASLEVPLNCRVNAAHSNARVPSPSRVVMRAELMASLQAAKQTLPPEYLEIIELRSVQQLPYEEIARRLDRSADASRKLWCRAVEALQTELLSQDHDISGL